MSKNKKKNSNYKVSFAPQDTPTESNNRFVIVLVSVFLAVVIAVGGIFAIVLGIKNSRAFVKYDGITLSKEETYFFASYYKNQYMASLSKSGVAATDTQEFWNTKCNYVNTYGEFLEYNTREYLKQIIISNHLFDTYTKLTESEKKDLKLAASEILDYQASGDVDKFNSATEKFGFSYSNFYKVTEMLYKTLVIKRVLFGDDGSKIASETELCEDYLSEYSHVKLMFIRTEKDFKLDEDGNRVQEDNQDVLIELSEEEKAKRKEDITAIRNAIIGIETGAEIQMSPTMFDNYLAIYKSGYDDKDANGFYFHEDSEYTKEFSSALPDVVAAALDMNVNTYKEVKTDFGVCFIYKYQATPGAYTEKSDTSCFTDFYKNASAASFEDILKELSENVSFTDNYDSLDVIALPNNGVYYPRF